MQAATSESRWSIDQTGAWVSFRVDDPRTARALCESVKSGKEYTLEVKKQTKKRSKSANDLLWELCTQISQELAKDKVIVSKEEIYRQHIKTAGKCDFVAVVERAVEDLEEGWSRRGIGWFSEIIDDCKIPGCKKICLYYGSSSYTTEEMSRLLDSVIQQCEDLNIPVMSEAEIALLKEEWK